MKKSGHLELVEKLRI